MKLLAIDPGNEKSAWVLYDTEKKLPIKFAIEDNNDVLERITELDADAISIEMVASYGMAVGRHVFETCVWIGRYIQAWLENCHGVCTQIYRKDVKMHLCGQTKAKDSNIRQAIMNRYGSTRQKAQGTKSKPGPLYGVSKDVWAALGVAITTAETGDEE